MHGDYFSYGLLGLLAIALLFAAFTDIRRRQIDNWLNIAIAACAPLFWIATGLSLAEIGWQLGIAVATIVVTAALFAMRAMGGGDVKLLTALALWVQPLWFLRLLIAMALIGGVLTLVMGMWHLARRQKDKLAIPYGVAIAVAGLWTLSIQYLPAFQAGAHAG